MPYSTEIATVLARQSRNSPRLIDIKSLGTWQIWTFGSMKYVTALPCLMATGRVLNA